MNNLFTTKQEKIISSIGIIVAGGTYIWWAVNSSANKAGYIASFVALSLFVVICLFFVHAWIKFWSHDYCDDTLEQTASAITLIVIFALFIIVSIADYFAVYLIRLLLGNKETFKESLNIYLNLDTGNYLNIAEYLYKIDMPAPPERIVFYPAYPLFIRFINILTGNYLASAILISVLFYAASGCMLYKLLLLDYESNDAKRMLKYFAILPGAFFFAFPTSESLFFFSSLCCFFFARKNKWMVSCFFGILAAFTRSLGVLLIAPLVFEAVSRKEKVFGKVVLSLSVALGTIAYLFINYAETGNVFAFSQYESQHWGQQMGFFFGTSAYQIDNALADIQTPYFTSALGIWFPNVVWCFGTLFLVAFAAKRMRASYLIWFIVYYFFAISPTFLISAPRYLVACVPIYAAIIEIVKRRKIDISFSIFCLLGSVFYIYAFSNLWDVY